MTPELKAKELVDKFNELIPDRERIAKQCAIICCDEIINEYETKIIYSSYDYDRSMWQSNQDEWEEIKTEIKRL